MRQALKLMATYGVSEVPVLSDSDCVGSLNENTVMARALENGGILEKPVSEVMGPPYPVVDAMLPVERLTAFLSRESPAVLVRKDGKIGGIVTRYDVLRQVSGIR